METHSITYRQSLLSLDPIRVTRVADTIQFAVLRMSFGTWCEVSLRECNWTISRHMIFAGRALGSAI